MIEIDLLPEERKPVERTPLPRFIAILTGVILTSMCLVAGGYLWFVKIPALTAKRNDLQEEKEQKQKKVEVHDKLQKKVNQLKKVERTIEKISPDGMKETYRWSYATDQLLEAIDRSPGIWISSFTGTRGENQQQRGRGRGSGGKTLYSLQFRVHGAGQDLEQLLDFERRIKARLIDQEKLFTNFNKVFRDYKKGELKMEEFTRPFWYSDVTLDYRKRNK